MGSSRRFRPLVPPAQALARPELRRSGRLYPERLARAIAEAHDPDGAVSDPAGNAQPYLTNMTDGQIRWVTIAHREDVTAVVQTDAATGDTTVWRPPRGQRLLSNTGAARLAETIPVEWTACCDGDGHRYRLRWVTEPRPLFRDGRLHYLVSVVPDRIAVERYPTPWLGFDTPVDRTVLIDAHERVVVETFEHADFGGHDAPRSNLPYG